MADELKVTRADVEFANRVIGDTPPVVMRRVVARIEDERRLPRGCIISHLRRLEITNARYDAIFEVWRYFKEKNGRDLSQNYLAWLFSVHTSTISYAFRSRGIKKN